MRRILSLILSFLVVSFGNVLCGYSQTISEKSERENAAAGYISGISAESGGNIEIDIPSDILEQLIPEKNNATTSRTPGKVSSQKSPQGWRIQIFSDGRNQSTLQSRANARANAVLSRFPKYRGQVYSFSKAPNWYTRIGNFKTQAEASSALAELKRAFPKFASEMRVVRSQISNR